MKPIVDNPQLLTPHYARYRNQLCQNDPQLESRLRAGRMEQVLFANLIPHYDLLLLDAFGVLNRGAEAIAGAASRVAQLQHEKRAMLVLSNNASQSPERLTRQLHTMGFTIPQQDILTSGMAIQPFVADTPFRDLPYYLVGTADSEAAYAPDPARLCVNHRPGDGWQAARYILLCSNRSYYGSSQQQQVEWLLHNRPLPVLLANPDLVTPDAAGGLSVVAGYTAAEWFQRFQTPWVGIGKPFAPIFALARHRFPHIPPQRILMVGDTLDTDILGGAAAGFATCLTLSGATPGAGESLESLVTQRGIRPDYVVQSIAD